MSGIRSDKSPDWNNGFDNGYSDGFEEGGKRADEAYDHRRNKESCMQAAAIVSMGNGRPAQSVIADAKELLEWLEAAE